MIDQLLSIIAPHYCLGCTKIGSELCGSCKYNIVNEENVGCLLCGEPSTIDNLCGGHNLPYSRAWLVGPRADILEKLINFYKFERMKSAHKALASLLDTVLPELPPNTLVVPVPTINKHIRERSYDHAKLLAKRLARVRGWHFSEVLGRAADTEQRQAASAAQREQQAAVAFFARQKLSVESPVLLVDDVITTGSTVFHAASVLRAAGAQEVWVAALARQVK